jgi:hypothetical protein
MAILAEPWGRSPSPLGRRVLTPMSSNRHKHCLDHRDDYHNVDGQEHDDQHDHVNPLHLRVSPRGKQIETSGHNN